MPPISGSESDASLEATDWNRVAKPQPRRRKLMSLSISATGHGLPEPVLRIGSRTIYTHGRPPWYSSTGQVKQPFVIGICGGSASGKTTVAREIISSLDVQWVSLFSMDSYYKALTPEERQLAAEGHYNFDHPNALDNDLMHEHLVRLIQGKAVEVPEYDFKSHSRTSKTTTLYGANVIVFEGLLAFYWPAIVKLIDLKVFVDTDADVRLARRLRRDIAERGRDLENVLTQYTRFVKPAYEQFIAPSMAQADIIIPRGGKNKVALQLINQHVNKRLKQHEVFRHALVKLASSVGNDIQANGSITVVKPCGDTPDSDCDLEQGSNPGARTRQGLSVIWPLSVNDNSPKSAPFRLPPRVHVLPPTPQTRGLHTIMRDRGTQQDDFVFYSERLMRPLCEFAMNLLPHTDVSVETPQGDTYEGRELAPGTQVCGVSVVRSGEALESALCDVCKDIRLGKILIQTNPETCDPELHYLRLPNDIKNCFVILMESTVATGAAAVMAMRVLVEHDVPEDRIILISLLMSIQGVHAVAYTFPKAHIITTAVDGNLSEQFHILPGMGNFGDRYFGTTPE